MTDRIIQQFNRALDGLLGLGEIHPSTEDALINANIQMAQAIQKITFAEEMEIPVGLRQDWIAAVSKKKDEPIPFLSRIPQPLWLGLIMVVLALLIGFYQPVLAEVSQIFGYVYLPDVGFLPRNSTLILAQAVRQQHDGQSVTVRRGVASPSQTILFIEFNDAARAVDGAWLELASGEKISLESWQYFPNQPQTHGIRLIFPALPENQTSVTLALREGWRIPLQWIPATQSALPNVQAIPFPATATVLTESTALPCAEDANIKLCLSAATRDPQNISLLLKVDFKNPDFKRSDLGLTWQSETQAVQLITDQNHPLSMIREEQDTLLFPLSKAGQKFTLSIPAILADVTIPQQFLTIDVGKNPQANQTIPMDASVLVLGNKVHFSKATLVGDGIQSLRLTLHADQPLVSEHGITPVMLQLGKPDKIDDLYGSGILGGENDIFVELIRPTGKINGVIKLPIIAATVSLQGPFEFPFVLAPNNNGENGSQFSLPTPAVLEVNPNNYTPAPTSSALSLTAYDYHGEKIQAGDLIYTLVEGNQTHLYRLQAGNSPRLLVDLPGVVTQVFVHPDRLGLDYLAGVSQTKNQVNYVDDLQLYSLRFDQTAPRLLYSFPPNPDGVIGTAISADWSYDGQFAIFRLPNQSPGRTSGWRYLWMNLQCRTSPPCQAEELNLSPNLDLYSASFAPTDFRILFSGADLSSTGKMDIFLSSFSTSQMPSSPQNLTAAYPIGDGITPALWSNSGLVFTLCSLDASKFEPDAFCWLDPNTAKLKQVEILQPVQNGMRLYGNYWISAGGKYLVALFFPANALWGETLPTLRLLNLEAAKALDLDKAQALLTSAFSADERYLAYIAQTDQEWKWILVDLQSNSLETINKFAHPFAAYWMGWVK
ncbi:MAG: hypothetical protein ACPL3P_04980 [Anaerolineales bacterium]